MALEQKLSLRLAQRLVMTPSLQQAIKLLQMTRMELQTAVAQELVENPVLEEVEETQEEEAAATTADLERQEEKKEPEEGELDHEASQEEIDLEAYFNDYYESSTEPSVVAAREAPPLENTVSREPDLYDHLLWQLHMAELPPAIREVAEIVIGNLDPDGFLVATIEEMAGLGTGLNGGEPYPEETVREALALVRGFDPPGVAWPDLAQSLLAQLDAQGEAEDSLVRRVISEAWGPFLRRQFPAIAKLFGIPLPELEPVVERIRSLETRPGRRYSTDTIHYVEPDVTVVMVSGEYVIQLSDDGLPRLRVSRAYRRMLQQMRGKKSETEARQYIQEKMRSALWLIKSLDQRQRTIYKVATSIVQQQKAFLDRGIDHLRPMVLRDVADDIGMHESTVSRVVSNKYIHTPRGLYPMKFFFHSGIDRDYGEDISSLTVKRMIERLIGEEDGKKPLSDNKLAQMLKREGINIARRTVAKYRDELSIPSSTDRRQIF